MAQISVMMAAYNTEAYIRRALDSILSQTFQDFDVIVVDDGSQDATGAIAEAYAQRDDRIHVLHQENAGTCITRNVCLDWTSQNSDSQWVIFVDSDDWLHPEMLERMWKAAQDFSVGICVCGYKETTGDDPVVRAEDCRPQTWKTMDFYQKNYVNAIMACCKLYRKSCYAGIRHPEGRFHFDDEFVTYRVLYREENMVFLPAPLYAYYVNDNGLTKQVWNPSFLDAWVAYEEQIAFFKEKNRPELVKFRYRGYLENAMVNLREAMSAQETTEIVEARKRIVKTIRRLLWRMWHEGCIDFWIDYDILYRFYPTLTRIYRFWLDRIRRGENA